MPLKTRILKQIITSFSNYLRKMHNQLIRLTSSQYAVMLLKRVNIKKKILKFTSTLSNFQTIKSIQAYVNRQLCEEQHK